jgi:hypothetical protein
MLELAKAARWPRVTLRRPTRDHAADSVGPGVTPWYALAEQMPDAVVAVALEQLEQLEQLELEPAADLLTPRQHGSETTASPTPPTPEEEEAQAA